MRSASDDLTTRARIRDAAVTAFGRNGFAATSVRAIAEAAGVSPALVLHHYGSKDGLRHACDRHIVDEFLGRRTELAHGDAAGSMARWLADIDRFRPQIDYLARMLLSGTAAADELFDELLDATRAMLDDQIASGVMRDQSDREVVALYLTLHGLAPLVMRRHLARALGSDFDADAIRRSTLPILELYTHGLYTDDRMLVAARDALARTVGPHSDKGDHDPNQDPDPPAAARS